MVFKYNAQIGYIICPKSKPKTFYIIPVDVKFIEQGRIFFISFYS